MKIPEVFIPEKNLENKIRELGKKPKNRNPKDTSKPGYNKLNSGIIYNQAKEIAEKLGELDLPFTIYNFVDKKTGMTIEYASHWGRGKTHLRIDVRDKHSFPIVFEAVQYINSKKQKILMYIPGEWQDHLREIYKKVQT